MISFVICPNKLAGGGGGGKLAHGRQKDGDVGKRNTKKKKKKVE